MIFTSGFLPPTREQVRSIKKHADESFCSTVPETFGLVPTHDGYSFSHRELTALSLSYVEAHQDPWVSDHRDGDGEDGPDKRRAIFWLLDTAEGNSVILHAGTRMMRMKPGDFVVFDDSIMHSVYSPRKWWGLAYQLRPDASYAA